MTPSHLFISRHEVQKLNEKHGWFEFRDAQSDVSNAFANEAIHRYEQIRSAAPDLIDALQDLLSDYDNDVADIESALLAKCRRAISKATGKDV